MSKLFDGNHHSFRVEESEQSPGWPWPEVTVILPGFAIQGLRENLPPCFRGQVHWESTDLEKIRLYIPTPEQRLGMANQEVLAAQKAFSSAVDSAQKSVARLLELSKAGGNLIDLWVLAPSQWMYQVWRFRCSTLDLETMPYDLRRVARLHDDELISKKEAEYAEWLAKEIEGWIEGEASE